MILPYFPALFEPFTLGAVTARNRIVHAPMSVCYADENSFITQAVIEHYARRAQGGVGIVMTENFAVNTAGRQLPKQALIAEEKHVAGLHHLTTEIKRYGALAIVQIVHVGRYARPWNEYEKYRRLAPSALPFPLLPGRTVTPQEITIEEIEKTIVAFGQAAYLAQQADFRFVVVK